MLPRGFSTHAPSGPTFHRRRPGDDFAPPAPEAPPLLEAFLQRAILRLQLGFELRDLFLKEAVVFLQVEEVSLKRLNASRRSSAFFSSIAIDGGPQV